MISPTRPSQPPALSRRSLVTSAAWAVPAIVAATATPAFAVSAQKPTVTVSTPGMQSPAAGDVTATVQVTDADGTTSAGHVVSFTSPEGVSFSPPTPTTSGSGIATTTMTTTNAWATPGSTITITALSDGASGSAAITQLGANALVSGSGSVTNGTTTTWTPTQLPLVFPSPVTALVSNRQAAYALLENGTVWSVGSNGYGQLGDGTKTDRSTWAVIPSLSNVKQVAAFSAGAYALLGDGSIRSWGTNNLGQLGNGTTTQSSSPTVVSGVTSAVAVAGGGDNGYALLRDGSVVSWGFNYYGQIGNGTVGRDSSTWAVTRPTQVGLDERADSIVAGGTSAYALMRSATIRAWGDNRSGQLGNNSSAEYSSTIVVVGNLSGMKQIAGGGKSAYALSKSGQVFAWGSDSSGALGTGNGNSSKPVRMLSGVSSLTAGAASGYALRSEGTLSVWGSNYQGQLGDGTTTDRATPVTITPSVSVSKLMTSSPTSTTQFLVH